MGLITIHHKGCFLISHTLISFLLQIAFPSSLACVRVCLCMRCFFFYTLKDKCKSLDAKRKRKKQKLTALSDLLPAPSAGSLLVGGPGEFLGAVRAQVSAIRPAIVLTTNCLMCGQSGGLWSCGLADRCPVDRVCPSGRSGGFTTTCACARLKNKCLVYCACASPFSLALRAIVRLDKFAAAATCLRDLFRSLDLIFPLGALIGRHQKAKDYLERRRWGAWGGGCGGEGVEHPLSRP